MEENTPDIILSHSNNYNFVKNNSIDFILTDPPFNISKKTNFHTYEKNTIHSYQFDSQNEEQWDTYSHEDFLVKLDEWAKEWSRVLKKGGNFAIFCADSYVSHLMEALKANDLLPRRLITWRKNNAVPVNRAYMPMSATEYIIVGVKKGKSTFNADVSLINQTLDDKIIEANLVADKVSTIMYSKIASALLDSNLSKNNSDDHIDDVLEVIKNTLITAGKDVSDRVKSMYKSNNKDEKYLQGCVPNYIQNPLKTGHRIHPTEKPVNLLKYLVALYSNAGDVILDGFGGSGSTAAACYDLSRRCIVIEQDKNFFDAIIDRFSEEKNGFLAPTIKIITQEFI